MKTDWGIGLLMFGWGGAFGFFAHAESYGFAVLWTLMVPLGCLFALYGLLAWVSSPTGGGEA